MYRPWLYGTSLYLGKVTDFAKPTAKWDGIGNVPMSVEFRLKSNVSRGGTEFSILGWDGSNKWFFGLIDAKNLFFEFLGKESYLKMHVCNAVLNLIMCLQLKEKRYACTRMENLLNRKSFRLNFYGILMENRS